jgi:hypothetical protein
MSSNTNTNTEGAYFGESGGDWVCGLWRPGDRRTCLAPVVSSGNEYVPVPCPSALSVSRLVVVREPRVDGLQLTCLPEL